MLDMGFFTRQELEEAIRRQSSIFKEKLLPERLSRDRLISDARLAVDRIPLLGETLIEMGLITKKQLDDALNEQGKTVNPYKALKSEQLATSIEIGSILNSTLNLSELLANIMKWVNRLTNSAASTLMLLDEETGELVFSVPTGPKAEKLTDIRIPPGKGIAGWVAEHEEPVLVSDVKEDKRFYSKIDKISGLETKSILCVPLKAKTKLIGVLEAINKADGTSFTQEDALMLNIFANQAAMAIESARTYRELQESEERYKRLIESSPDLIYAFSNKRGGLYWSTRAKEILGYSSDDLIENPFIWYNSIHPDDLPVVNKAIEESFNGKAFNIEYRIKDKGEKWHWLIDRNISIKTDKDEVVIEGIATDITERKEAEEELRESEKRFKDLANMFPETIFEMDLQQNMTYGNQKAFDHFRYEQKDFDQGLNAIDMIVPEDRPKASENIKKILGGKEIGLQEYTVLRKDGSIFPAMIHSASIHHEGKIVGLRGIIVDITVKKQAEEARRESEEKYRTIIENIEEGYFEVDLAGNYTFVNDSLCKSHGYSREELMGMNNRKYMDPETAKHFYKIYNEVYKTGNPVNISDYTIITKDGSRQYRDSSVSLMKDSKDRPFGFRGITRDITERKKMEDERLKMEKLESIGVLAGGIAHDFNNILTAIIGNISLAKTSIKQGDEIFELLSEAEQACWKAQHLTQQLLTFSKGGSPVKKTASIEEIIKESAEFALRGSNVRCEFSVPEDLCLVEIDHGQISQVIHNLILNADQAMPQGGTIQIHAENTILETTTPLPLKPGSYIRMHIQDKGIGISDEHLSKIFDPYFTTKQKGSGLGLATVYSIVKKHDGHIEVNSQLGVGTEFVIYLPASGKTAVKEEETEESLVMSQGKILLMDDEPLLRDIASKMLAKLGYEIACAKDGEEAIGLYKNAKELGQPFDAVVMDLTIPGGMGGKDAITKLLEIDPEAKAVVSSGYSADPVMANFRDYGFSGVIPKPFNHKDLSEILNKLLVSKDK